MEIEFERLNYTLRKGYFPIYAEIDKSPCSIFQNDQKIKKNNNKKTTDEAKFSRVSVLKRIRLHAV